MTNERLTFLEMADRLAQRLCQAALWSNKQCSWAGIRPVQVPGGYKHLPGPLGPDFYAGSAGNLFFLSRLFRVTSDKALLRVAEGAAHDAVARLDDIPPLLRMGFYAGWAGIAFALIELGETTRKDTWHTKGVQILKRLTKVPPAEQGTEVFFGAAGTLISLLSIYSRYNYDWAGDFATALGTHLITKARKSANGWSWQPFGPLSNLHRDHLTGFAHGVAGIAWTLLELSTVTGDKQYLQAAEEGFRYENSWYRPDAENWLDLRYFPGPDGDQNDGNLFQIQWCHGAVGIGLTRLRAFQLLNNDHYRENAHAALQTTIRDLERFPNNAQPNYSLCHGMAGNSDLLLLGADILGDAQLQARAEQVGQVGIERFEHTKTPWPSALTPQEIPALMTGIAGTGYFYLRLHNPRFTPPITLISPKTP